MKRRHKGYIRAGRKVLRRRSSSGFSSLTPIIAGLGAGVALSFLQPYLQKYIPNVAGVPSAALGAIAVGAGTKLLLKKDPMRIPTAMMMIGGAMVGSSLLSGTGAVTTSGTDQYANSL